MGARRRTPSGPYTRITLRNPAEVVCVGNDERWIDLSMDARFLNLFGRVVDDRQDRRSVPLDRIISIDSERLPVVRAEPHPAA